MSTTDIEKLYSVSRMSQQSGPDGDCTLVRINETESGETTQAPFTKPLYELDVIETPCEYQHVSLQSDSGISHPRVKHLKSLSTTVSGKKPNDGSYSSGYRHVSQETTINNSKDVEAPSPRSHSDTNVPFSCALSPIIIRTSCLTDENSTEIVHPVEGRELAACFTTTIKDRGISASLNNLKEANFCTALRKSHQDDVYNLFKEETALMDAQNKHFIFRTVSDSTEECHTLNAESATMTRLIKQSDVLNNEKSPCDCCHRIGAGEMGAQVPIIASCGRCTCCNSFCPCRKKHAASVVNLPSLRRSRKTPGLDEISYDFMRASGAISGNL